MFTRSFLQIGLACGVSILATAAAAQNPVADFLKHEITGNELPLAEVQRYVEARVPRMPSCATAAEWQAEADRLRRAVLEQVVYRGEAASWRDAEVRVEWRETIDGGPGYRIKKLRYEALPGLWIPALLYEPEGLSGRVPGVLNVNGHTSLGKQYPPKQIRCIHQAKRGMLALNIEWVGMGQLATGGFSHARMNQLDLCGTAGLAPFYLCMKRGLDVLLSLEHTDPQRVAVTGLSGGGWQTILLSALDTRVTLANPVAGYSSFLTRARHFKDLGDSEQTPTDLATVADYTHLTAMLAPRPTLLTYNAKDNCCFESGYALQPLLDAAGPMFRLFDKPDALRSHVNEEPGTHNYELDNRQAFYRMLGDFFFPGNADFDVREIPSDSEVKTAEQLNVELPSPNADFHTLAMALSRSLPRGGDLPRAAVAASGWQTERLQRLRDVVRAKDYKPIATEAGRESRGDVTAVYWRLLMDADWTVPVVELAGRRAEKTAVLVADGGRQAVGTEATQLLSRGYRVLAVDPFYFGESKIRQSDWLFALLVAAVGDRPLGLQASQLAAVARWAAGRESGQPVELVAIGPRTGVSALVAAGLEKQAVGAVELRQSLGSLKEIIERNAAVAESPELFCFGLLECCDIKPLAALVAPRPVRFSEPSERAKQELAGLDAWYELLGSHHDPLSP
ncbi:MAG: acetylxylan esterase [Candidatus Anammoximicrobium sp.]|nr:acetylxylan esterase [Candidatus Anammoximicrobium sp.]